MRFPDVKTSGGGANGKGGLYIKLVEGEKIKGIFRGDPKIFHTHWIENKSIPCVGKATCLLCKEDKSKFRFRINFIVNEDGIYVAKIFEGAYATFLELKEMHENDYNLEETLVNITRTGQKQQTRYLVMPVKNNGGLDELKLKTIQKIPLNELGEKKEQDVADNDLDKALGDKF